MQDEVVFQYQMRLAARKAHKQAFHSRQASVSEITPFVLEAFGCFISPSPMGKTAFLNVTRKLKTIAEVFGRNKKLWETFKKKIGVKSILELPRVLKDLAKKGLKALQKAISRAFDSWPLKLYTLPESKMMSFNRIIEGAMKQFPQFQRWMKQNVKPRVDLFDMWLKKHLPVISGALMIAVYVWIWMNVVEFEWDMQSLIDAVTGKMALSDLLSSLPGSAFGFLLTAFNFGTFTLLPATIAARMMILITKRYVVWDGGLKLDRDRIAADFG